MTESFSGKLHVNLLLVTTNLTFIFGFELLYKGVTPCWGETFTNRRGVLYSSNFPANYSNMQDRVTKIDVKNAILIEIMFEAFHTESLEDYNMLNELCDIDYVEIAMSERKFRICGNWSGKESTLYFRLNTSNVQVRFVSNHDITRQGYVMRWFATSHTTSLQTTCAAPLVETSHSCYEMVMEAEVWELGHEACRVRGAVLAEISDAETHAAVEKALNERNVSGLSFWIGASDRLHEGDFVWTDRSSVMYHNWFPGWLHDNGVEGRGSSQPSDDGFSNEDCVEMRRLFTYADKGTRLALSYFWNDRNCSVKNPFICQHHKSIKKRSAELLPIFCDVMLNLTEDTSTVVTSSPNFPNLYPKLSSCHTIITAPFGKQIALEFLHMDVEEGKGCEYDNLTISSFPTSERRSSDTVVYCGNWNRRLKLLRWTSYINKVVLHFRSDSSKQRVGFQVKAHLVDQGYRCQTNSSSFNWVYGPGGCWAYPNIVSNVTSATTTCLSRGGELPGNLQDFSFISELIAEANIAAQTDNITGCTDLWTGSANQTDVTSGVNENETQCNSVSTCQDRTVGSYYGNVKSIVNQGPCSRDLAFICRRPVLVTPKTVNTTTLSAPLGSITWSGSYGNNVMYMYVFESPTSHRILVEIHSYSIEYQDQCLYDRLESKQMVNDRIVCGKSTTTQTLISQGNNASLILTSDDDVTDFGFNASYYWLPSNGVFTVNQTSEYFGTIHTINFGRTFPDRVEGCYTVVAPDEHTVVLDIGTLQLPGKTCAESQFNITSGVQHTKTICGGDTLDVSAFQGIFVSEKRNVTVCISSSYLDESTGFHGRYSYEYHMFASVSKRIHIDPNTTMILRSVRAPARFPSEFAQSAIIRTELGYVIRLVLNITTFPVMDNCPEEMLRIVDMSLIKDDKSQSESVYSCINETAFNGTYHEQTFNSFLNSFQISLISGANENTTTFMAYATSVIDPLFLTKTVKERGFFDFCDNTTCMHGGTCESVALDDACDPLTNGDKCGRFKCNCRPQYTGLFCQASRCDLEPCHHGNCSLTTSGYVCTCRLGYFGPRCDMDTFVCQHTQCSGHGKCVIVNTNESACICNAQWAGVNCDTMVPSPDDSLTIGQKLLKEPIWIGMIVMLNLVVFFCVSYVIRRKCGRRISRLFPKTEKPSSSKDESRTNSVAAACGRDIYSLQVEIPRIHELTEALSTITLPRESSSAATPLSKSAPTTPVITEHNRDAALRLFAAYNANVATTNANFASSGLDAPDPIPSNIRDIMSCGIQGGMVSFNDELGDVEEIDDSSIAILRSYTYSAGSDLNHQNEANNNEVLRKTNTFSGRPKNSIYPVKDKFRKPIRIKDTGVPSHTSMHCYPEIRILNEFNEEQSKGSSSEASIVPSLKQFDNDAQLASKTAEEDVRMNQYCDVVDSGYPSTTVSSSTNTQGGVIPDVAKTITIMSPSAAERRKLFSSKAKSASFYNICDDVDSNIPLGESYTYCDRRKTQYKPKHRTMSVDFSSFESEACVSCSRVKIRREAISCESDLDKVPRRKATRGCYVYDAADDERRSRRRRLCGCHKCYRHVSRDSEHSPRSPRSDHRPRHHHYHRRSHNHHNHQHRSMGTSRHLSQGEISEIRRNLRRGLVKLSSTESDNCNCQEQSYRYRRRNKGTKASHSEGSLANMSPALDRRNSSDRGNSPKWDSFKTKMMLSFLSDSNALAQEYGSPEHRHDSHESPTRTHSMPSPSFRSRSSSHGRRAHARSLQPSDSLAPPTSPDYHNQTICKQPNNCNQTMTNPVYDAQNMADNQTSPNDDFLSSGRSLGPLSPLTPIEFVKKFRFPFNSSCKSDAKDSAYQTKQSSVDRVGVYQTKQSSTDRVGLITPREDPTITSATAAVQSQLVETVRSDDKIRRHLDQAALKLAVIKSLQAKTNFSKDSAINTFSEEDLSNDEADNRRPLVKRISGTLAFQMKELNLSQVKEEGSQSYNTPNNEQQTEAEDQSTLDRKSPINAAAGIQPTEITTVNNTMQETMV